MAQSTRATNIFTRGTSNGFAPSELGPFDYEKRSTRGRSGSWKALRNTTRTFPRPGGRRPRATSIFGALSDADPLAAHDTGTAGAVGRDAASYDAWIKYYRSDENTPEHGRSATT